MEPIKRRSFLSLVGRASAGTALLPLLTRADPSSCWLDVCAPFIIQDSAAGIESEIVLTSDNFVGASGYADGADATEYEIYLYDSEGKPLAKTELRIVSSQRRCRLQSFLFVNL